MRQTKGKGHFFISKYNRFFFGWRGGDEWYRERKYTYCDYNNKVPQDPRTRSLKKKKKNCSEQVYAKPLNQFLKSVITKIRWVDLPPNSKVKKKKGFFYTM